MNDEWIPKTLRGKNISKPSCVSDAEEFYLLIHSYLVAAGFDSAEKVDFGIFGMKLILHEYLASVLNGYIKPYEMSDFSQDEIDAFHDCLIASRQILGMNGVFLKEEDGGKLKIDFKRIFDEHGEDMSSCGALK